MSKQKCMCCVVIFVRAVACHLFGKALLLPPVTSSGPSVAGARGGCEAEGS